MRSALVITVSDRSAAGERDDTSGPTAVQLLEEAGFAVGEPVVVPDEVSAIATVLKAAIAEGVALVVTTGGTGLGPRDVTPEATTSVIDREVPGLTEMMRAAGRAKTPLAALSRAVAGTAGGTLIINLPGRPTGVTESLEAVLEVLPHALDVLAGPTDH